MLFQGLAIIGWQYLPTFATTRLLPVFHHFIYRPILRRTPPPVGSPKWQQHYRYMFALVILCYLCYNFRRAALSTEPTYYEILGVQPNADENTLKLAFRQFARKFHPDRVGPRGEAAFIEVRDAFEALKNPVTRFAYDRFGPEALKWSHCTTLRDYVQSGLMRSSGFYIASIGILVLVSFVQGPTPTAFWRHLLFVSLFTYELSYIMSSSLSVPSNSPLSAYVSPSMAPISLFSLIWPRRVAWQHIRFLHSGFLFCSVALARVAPVLFPDEAVMERQRLMSAVQNVQVLATSIDREVAVQLSTELYSVHGPRTDASESYSSFAARRSPHKPDERVLSLLEEEMENMIIEGHLADGGPLKSAADIAIARRRRAEAVKIVRELEPQQTGTPSPTPSPPPGVKILPGIPLTSTSGWLSGLPTQGYFRGRSVSY